MDMPEPTTTKVTIVFFLRDDASSQYKNNNEVCAAGEEMELEVDTEIGFCFPGTTETLDKLIVDGKESSPLSFTEVVECEQEDDAAQKKKKKQKKGNAKKERWLSQPIGPCTGIKSGSTVEVYQTCCDSSDDDHEE